VYALDVLVQGFPGRAPNIGGVGWSTVPLLRGAGRAVLVDTGSYNHRPRIVKRLAELGLRREDVTDVLVTHPHYDHCINYPFFPNARVYVSKIDLEWAAALEPGTEATPELHIADMLKNQRVETIAAGDEVLPGIVAFDASGHTPGHLGYRAKGTRGEVIFTGDSVKNRAELASRTVDMTYDMARSQVAIDRIRAFAQADPENLIVPGHDTLLAYEGAELVGRAQREVFIRAWMSTDFNDVTIFDLTQPPRSK
jgi:N-acyl homoserine lactone hydrolase